MYDEVNVYILQDLYLKIPQPGNNLGYSILCLPDFFLVIPTQ